jgi:Mg/Co/Ni transporter MgtE
MSSSVSSLAETLLSTDFVVQVIQSLTLIVSFMPAISALSGNLGLQASANTIRGLGTGHIPPSKYCSNITKEVNNFVRINC